MLTLPNTTTIISGAEYFSSASEFAANFELAFDIVRCQILKLETRQFYLESGNPSYEAMKVGDWDLARHLMETSRAADRELYSGLRVRGVDFVRCRPVSYPINDYLKWEFMAYDLNEAQGERIFCCNILATKEIFDEFARHDFMVFDSRLALIHNYDDRGELVGGWRVSDPGDIMHLQSLFIYIKSFCTPHKLLNRPK